MDRSSNSLMCALSHFASSVLSSAGWQSLRIRRIACVLSGLSTAASALLGMCVPGVGVADDEGGVADDEGGVAAASDEDVREGAGGALLGAAASCRRLAADFCLVASWDTMSLGNGLPDDGPCMGPLLGGLGTARWGGGVPRDLCCNTLAKIK